jgi:hypothetical protein
LTNRLKKKQKEALIQWVAEGLESGEINARAANFDPPFVASRQHIQRYRDSRRINLKALQETGEMDALATGLALKAERVRKLQLLAALLENDLFGGFLWTEDVKMIGSGPFSKEVEFEEFNAAEVTQYRGILDDIAKEVGDRKSTVINHNIDVTALTDDELKRLAEGK